MRVAFAALLALLATPGAAHACVCSYLDGPAMFERVDAVFEGRVVSSRVGTYQVWIELEVLRVWKGEVPNRIEVEVDVSSSCATGAPPVGAVGILYGRLLHACSRWVAASQTDDYLLELAQLGPGAPPVATAPSSSPAASPAPAPATASSAAPTLTRAPPAGCAHCAASPARSSLGGLGLLALALLGLRTRRLRALSVLVALVAMANTSHAQRIAAGASSTCLLYPRPRGDVVECVDARSDRRQAFDAAVLRIRGDRVSTIDAGVVHTCAMMGRSRRMKGHVLCWGGNAHGQLGSSRAMAPFGVVSEPVLAPVEGDVVELSVGAMHTCVRTRGGDALCWGGNLFGELGHDGAGGPAPVRLPVREVVRVVAGPGVTCAVDARGATRCFGRSLGLPMDGVERFASGPRGECVVRSGALECTRDELLDLLVSAPVGRVRDVAIERSMACVAGSAGVFCAARQSPDEPIGDDVVEGLSAAPPVPTLVHRSTRPTTEVSIRRDFCVVEDQRLSCGIGAGVTP